MANLEANRSELRPTLDLILDQLAVVLDHESSAVLLLDNDRIELVAARGYPAEKHAAIAACPLADSVMLQRVLRSDEPPANEGTDSGPTPLQITLAGLCA